MSALLIWISFNYKLIRKMHIAFWSDIVLINVCWQLCQSSTMVLNVVEMNGTGSFNLDCLYKSSTNLTRWTYLAGPTGTSLMSYQNGQCTASPSDSFLTERRFSFTCNITMFQVTVHLNNDGHLINSIIACRDTVQLDGPGSTWIIRKISGTPCTFCRPHIVFNVQEVTEGDNVTFICRLEYDVSYVNWNVNFGSKTAAMGVQNRRCTTSPNTSFLNNTSKYIYTCNRTVYQVTILNVQRSEHNDMYLCTPVNQTGSNWIIKVKAPVTSVTITSSKYSVEVKENTVVKLTCTTSTARPAASVYWYRHPNKSNNDITQITNNVASTTDYNDLSITTSILRFVTTRQDNDTKIYCTAKNIVNKSPVRTNKKILLNVLYKAENLYILQGNKYRVIENTPGTLSCTTRGGNPTPTLSWSCINISPTNQTTINSNGNVTTTITWTPSRSHEENCTCTSQQTGFNDTTTNVTLVVLYPPSKPEFRVNGKSVDGDISFIEGNTRSIVCSADSNPSPDRYTWTGHTIASAEYKQSLQLINIDKLGAGEYICSAHNTMNPSNGRLVAGINSRTVNVVVLYPPVVLSMNNISKQNGTRLNVVCNFTAGIPENTSIKWTRDIGNGGWNTALLNISSLKKSDTGIYTCTANNTMTQSGDSTSYIGQHNQSLHLDVQYAASITSFSIDGFTSINATVNESDPVRFICNADSNPTAMMTLSYECKTKKTVKSDTLDHNITKASCQDAGTYYCSAQNKYNNENGVQNRVQVFVNCSPRLGEDVGVNITSEKDKTATIVFNAIAYPAPTFTWYQLVGGNWVSLHDSDHNVIKSANLQSNLTIHSVGIDDFTNYKVLAENEFGQMEQIYTLSPYDKPDPPTRLRHIEGRTATSSIHIEWEPGFDNGPSQMFYIKYKKSSDTVWNYLNVSDNGEPTMNITLTGLLENTQYEVIIYASNVKGNSTESNVLITRTKAIQNPLSISGALIGGVAGGLTGCIVIVIVIVIIIRRYPLLKGNGTDGQNIRRSVSADSDDEDGLVDNPMYGSSSNVASVTSTSASTSTDIYSKPVKPNKTNVAGNGDIYSVVNKTKGQGKGGKGKSTNEKGKQKEGDVYENVELENDHKKKDAGKQLPPKPLAKQPKFTIVNQDGLIYADLVFKDKPPGVKMVIIGDDSTPYDLVDFTKKADPLPESDEEEQK